jgi:hypothetical protein
MLRFFIYFFSVKGKSITYRSSASIPLPPTLPTCTQEGAHRRGGRAGITLMIKHGMAGELIVESGGLVFIKNPSNDSIQSLTATPHAPHLHPGGGPAQGRNGLGITLVMRHRNYISAEPGNGGSGLEARCAGALAHV